MHTYTTVAIRPNFMSSVLLCAVFLYICLNFKIFIIKIQKDSLLIFLVLNSVFITVYHVKAVQDDISVKLFPSDCIILNFMISQQHVIYLLGKP